MAAKVLFVCLGNICRSPTAHGIFRHKVAGLGLSEAIEVDSCGTGDWHVGGQPDVRSMRAAFKRGYDFSDLRARQLCNADFEYYDYILAMDQQNLHDIKRRCPSSYKGHLSLFLTFGDITVVEVPDPYYGGDQGFDHVVDLIEAASEGLLRHIQAHD